MDYQCEISDIFIKTQSKHEHFMSNSHKEFNKCKHTKLTLENPDINNVGGAFFEHIIEL